MLITANFMIKKSDQEISAHGREIEGARQQVVSWIKGIEDSKKALPKQP